MDNITKLNDLRSLDVSVNCISNDGLSHLARVISANSLRVSYREYHNDEKKNW